MIEVAEVSFRYDGAKPVLRRISLEVHEGERIAILGPNGSGKTTFARCLNGLLIPTEGQVLVDGFSPLQHPYEVRRRVGMAFQNPDSQIVSAVVEREVAFGLENLGVPTSEMRHRVAEALERFGLSGRRLHPPHRLSGGEKGRLILASLWAMRPRYLVLDEPTSLLDPEGRREVREAIDELAREGVAVLWITQYPEEALWADRVLVFFGGELVADAPPGKVLDDPERLARWGLRAPFPILLNHRLRSLGLPLPPWTPTLRDLADALSALPHSQTPILPRSHTPLLPRPERLSAEGVRYRYPPPGKEALKGVDFRAGAGEFVALLGHTGSGKTTLAQILAGLLRPSEGRVLLDGGEVRRGRVGLAFQFPEDGFFEETVLKDVAFGPKNLGLLDPESHARRALLQVGLDPEAFGHRSPFSLSGGEARRVGIAGVLAMDPEVLILDEPTAGLDPQGVLGFSEVLKAIRQEGRTIVLISHDMDLVAELAERAVVLGDGEVWGEGSVRELLSRPNLEEVGLEPPQSVLFARLLRERGWSVRPDLLTSEELVSAIVGALNALDKTIVG